MRKQKIVQVKRPLTLQLTVIIIALVFGTVLLCLLLNTSFLEKYYIMNKKDSMTDAYRIMNQADDEGRLLDESFDVEFEKISSNGNISMLVIQSDGTVVRSSVSDTEHLKVQFMEAMLSANGTREGKVEVLEKNNRYVLEKQIDGRMKSEYLVLWGTLESGDLILMRTALESIRESAEISNKFLAYIGVLAMVISAMVSVLISKQIAEPIIELTKISSRMTELDFEAKYQSGGKNEIDQLGEHINLLSETLEKTISELKSANNELQIDIEKKEQIDEMRKEFLSNVSHELKTPLALIQGYAEGLAECIHDDEESKNFYCDVIMDEADKMNQMVKKLLTLNQLEFGNDMVVMERFDLTEVVKGVISASSILLKQNGITLNFVTDVPMYVWADEFKVEEVLTNYLSNAIHHVNEDKKIEIKYTQKQDLVRVSVFNTGTPIPKEDIERIWIKFYKVDKARTREYGGSGIGLSIVKAIMQSFHRECGVINYENGVEFWFELDTKSN